MNLNLSKEDRVKAWQQYWATIVPAVWRRANPTPTLAPPRRSDVEPTPPPFLEKAVLGVSPVSCCGIRELTNLSGFNTAESALKSFAKTVYDPTRINFRFRFAVFSEANPYVEKGGYGTKFSAFITEHKLGVVVETGWHTNPNTGNSLKVWVWTVDHEAVRMWVKGVK